MVSGECHVLAILSPERDPGAHWIGGWVGRRARLEVLQKIEIRCPHRDSKLDLIVSSISKPILLFQSNGFVPVLWQSFYFTFVKNW
jgi:hypothetical protein